MNRNRDVIRRWTIVGLLFAGALAHISHLNRELMEARYEVDNLTAAKSKLLALVNAADKRAADEADSRSPDSRNLEEISDLAEFADAMKSFKEEKRALEMQAEDAKANK